MVELYLHSPILLHGMVLNYIIKYWDNFTFTLTHSSIGNSVSALLPERWVPKISLPFTNYRGLREVIMDRKVLE
jgi:hypothetical protein